jgi:hypothetical protein
VSINYPVNDSEFIEGDHIAISAYASDLIGAVEKVEFLVDNETVGTVLEAPYIFEWLSQIGIHSLTAIAYDNGGLSTQSQAVHIEVKPAPPCSGTAYNGEFDYKFSPDDNNPTITFLPSQSGIGTPTCILYYGTNVNSLPGYQVTPNVPYQITASEGEKIYFYYTYSFPGQGEHNNAAHKDSYVIGSCNPLSIDDYSSNLNISYYPNPVKDILYLNLPNGINHITIYDLHGHVLNDFTISGEDYHFDMGQFTKGLYLFKVVNNNRLGIFKIIK